MKNMILLLCGALLFAMPALQAQQVQEGPQKFKRKFSKNALSVVVQGQVKNVEDVMSELFRRETGDRGKSSKGMEAYEGVIFRKISPASMDYYYKVEKASKKDDIHSRIHLFIATGNDNFVSSGSHPEVMRNATRVLSGLDLDVKTYEFKLAIEEQEKILAKAQKDFELMIEDSVKLEVELAETLQEIEQNKIDRANQEVRIQEEQARLQEFKEELNRLIGKNEDD